MKSVRNKDLINRVIEIQQMNNDIEITYKGEASSVDDKKSIDNDISTVFSIRKKNNTEDGYSSVIKLADLFNVKTVDSTFTLNNDNIMAWKAAHLKKWIENKFNKDPYTLFDISVSIHGNHKTLEVNIRVKSNLTSIQKIYAVGTLNNIHSDDIRNQLIKCCGLCLKFLDKSPKNDSPVTIFFDVQYINAFLSGTETNERKEDEESAHRRDPFLKNIHVPSYSFFNEKLKAEKQDANENHENKNPRAEHLKSLLTLVGMNGVVISKEELHCFFENDRWSAASFQISSEGCLPGTTNTVLISDWQLFLEGVCERLVSKEKRDGKPVPAEILNIYADLVQIKCGPDERYMP